MKAIDIITIADAQEWLSAPDTSNLKRLIESSINFVEQYTGHSLVEKEKVVQLPYYGYGVNSFPMSITSVKNSNGDIVAYDTKKSTYYTYIFAPRGSYVTLKLGYTNLEDIPGMLVEVAYKMLTYMYENRDIYPATLPLDYQMMVNKYRRNLV